MNIVNRMSDVVTVRICGGGREKFLNLCSERGLRVSNVTSDDFAVTFSVKARDFKKMRPCVRKSGVRLKIVRKRGMGIYLKKRRRRYGFFLGTVAAALFFAYLTSCIWVIDIRGNETVSGKTILNSLEKHGLHVGCIRFGHDLKKLQNEVLIDLDSLAWMWVYQDGTKAIVEVREKGEASQIVDDGAVYNIVAAESGRISKIIAKSGQRVAQEGDVVNEGDLLISGVSSTAFRGNRYIHSDGYVFAETWRTKSGEYNHTKITHSFSGEKTLKKRLMIFGHEIKLFFNDKPEYEYYEKFTKIKNIKIFNNIYLPMTFTTDTFCEIIRKEEQISDSEVVATAVKKLTADIEKERGTDAKTIKKEYEYHKLDNGNILVSVSVESDENIALPVKIEVDKSEDNVSGENSGI